MRSEYLLQFLKRSSAPSNRAHRAQEILRRAAKTTNKPTKTTEIVDGSGIGCASTGKASKSLSAKSAFRSNRMSCVKEEFHVQDDSTIKAESPGIAAQKHGLILTGKHAL